VWVTASAAPRSLTAATATAAAGRLRLFGVVSSGRSAGLWHRQASTGCFLNFDPATGRRPMSAVPCKPVGGHAIFRLPARPVVAGTASSRTAPTADTGRLSLRVERQVPGAISYSRCRPTPVAHEGLLVVQPHPWASKLSGFVQGLRNRAKLASQHCDHVSVAGFQCRSRWLVSVAKNS
jgi:hypothetical protein